MKIFTHEDDLDSYTEYSWNRLPKILPNVVFQTRVRDESIEGPNPYRWEEKSTFDFVAGKRVIIFSLPGAFTPTCSTYQLPGFDELFPKFQEKGIDEIYCVSVNDAFVMNKWFEAQGVKNVKAIPDGNAKFTEDMQMSVRKENLGFGIRSWRYAVVVNNGNIESWFVEGGKEDDCETDPYFYTNPEFILEQL